MLYSQGMPLEALGIPTVDGSPTESDPRRIWRLFAEHYHLFRGTPSRLWLDWVFAEAFGLDVRLEAETADHLLRDDRRGAEDRRLPPARPVRAVRHRGHRHHRKPARPARPSPRDPGERLGRPRRHRLPARSGDGPGASGLRRQSRRASARSRARTSRPSPAICARTKIAAPSSARRARPRPITAIPRAFTADLPRAEAEALYAKIARRRFHAARRRAVPRPDADRDGADEPRRRHGDADPSRARSAATTRRCSPASAATRAPTSRSQTEYVRALKPLLDRFGNEPRLTLILFTLDEDVYSRELAPLAGHYPGAPARPALVVPRQPRRHAPLPRARRPRRAGFYNTVGFNDDTRAFLSIPARHDVARRMDCGFLARLVAEHRLEEDEAHEVARALAYDLVKAAYKL